MADTIPASTPIWTVIGVPILEAFGLQAEKVRAMDIRIAVGEPVIVKIEQFVPEESGAVLKRVLRCYRLIEDVGAATVTPSDSDDGIADATVIEDGGGAVRYARVGEYA